MNPKTIKVKTLAKGELFACDALSINGNLLDFPTLNQKTQFQSTSTSPNKTLFQGTVTASDLATLSTNLTAYFLKTSNITPTTSPLTITSNFTNVTVPNSSATGSLTCLLNLNVSNTTTFTSTLLRVLRTLVGSNSEITLTVGTNANFNATKITFLYSVTGSPNTSNYCNFGINTSAGFRIYANMLLVTNSLKVGEDFIKPTYLGLATLSNGNQTGVYSLISNAPTGTTQKEMNFCLKNFIFPNSGELYLQFSGNNSFTQLFSYTGVTRNASDTGIGTPLFNFLAPTGSTSAKPNRGWNQDIQGIPLFIGRFGDTTGSQRSLNSLVVKMYRFNMDNPSTWIVIFQGHIESNTMGTASPPYINGCGVIVASSGTYLPNWLRLTMKGSNTFINNGTTDNLRLSLTVA